MAANYMAPNWLGFLNPISSSNDIYLQITKYIYDINIFAANNLKILRNISPKLDKVEYLMIMLFY